jgi:undecaprenyl diphosphate synthase
VGIIMDGNGRWAEGRGRLRTQGHLEGLKAAKRIVKAASDRGISYLTLYVFSTENWKRAASEVGFIMGLVKRYLKGELDFYRENRIRIRHAGDPGGLPPDIARDLEEAMRETRDFGGLQVVLALNYGGRDEVSRAVGRLLGSGRTGAPGAEGLRPFLDNPDIPDPDLIIRTGGEWRLSNFLLWEAAYAEFYASPKLWPDWTPEDLEEALGDFRGRNRRFGAVAGASPEGFVPGGVSGGAR